MKTPDQDIFDLVYSKSVSLGYDTYLFNPPSKAKYPFVKLGSVQTVPISTKSRLLATVYQSVDIWGSYESRAEISKMAQNLLYAVSKLNNKNYSWNLNYRNSSVEVMADNSTNDDLWRARISLEWSLR